MSDREKALKDAASAAARYLLSGDLGAFDEVRDHLSHVFNVAAPAASRVLAAQALVRLSDEDIMRLARDLDESRCPLCAHRVTGRPFKDGP